MHNCNTHSFLVTIAIKASVYTYLYIYMYVYMHSYSYIVLQLGPLNYFHTTHFGTVFHPISKWKQSAIRENPRPLKNAWTNWGVCRTEEAVFWGSPKTINSMVFLKGPFIDFAVKIINNSYKLFFVMVALTYILLFF